MTQVSEQPAYPDAVEQAPVCPRHPDREAYVRCQRCGRPTCPECQRPAAVGIQCVDCVAEGARTVRSARTVFGGAVTDGRPVATMTIIGICVAVFVLQQVVPGLTGRVAFVPALGLEEPWRFLTSAFAHSPSSLLHIAFNMYALWIMGTYLEPLLGRARFVAVYLLSAVGGSVVYLLLSSPPTAEQLAAGEATAWYVGAVGASGAVFGLFGAFLVLQRRLGRPAAGMYVTIAINAVIGFVIPNIAWQAHLGGLLTGAAAAASIAYLGRSRGPAQPPNRSVHWVGLAGITGILLALTMLKYALV
jgi:membrane associated rhomboid family serine protease